MARRSSRRGAKIQPAVKTLNFSFDANSINYVDLSQCASLVNRRFYRQGLNWAVAGFTFFTNGVGTIGISKIPDTWIATNSWHKGYATWMKMNNEALAEVPSVRPKFLDFKVYLDQYHHAAGVGANLLPTTGDWDGVLHSGEYALGEWEMSKYSIPTSDQPGLGFEREVIWTGLNYPGAAPASNLNAVSLIEGYAASRGLPNIADPNAPDDASDIDGDTPANWLAATFNEGIDQHSAVIEDMIDENNQAPYPFENDGVNADTMYPGGANQAPGAAIHTMAFITATTVGGKTTISGTNFQGGLIRLDSVLDGASGDQLMQIHLVPGPARGYMTQPMQDV